MLLSLVLVLAPCHTWSWLALSWLLSWPCLTVKVVFNPAPTLSVTVLLFKMYHLSWVCCCVVLSWNCWRIHHRSSGDYYCLRQPPICFNLFFVAFYPITILHQFIAPWTLWGHSITWACFRSRQEPEENSTRHLENISNSTKSVNQTQNRAWVSVSCSYNMTGD